MSYAFQPVSKPEIVEAQRGNNNCIQKFLSSCKNNNIPLIILTYKDKINCNNVVLKEFLEGNDE